MVKYKEVCAASGFAGQVPEHLKGKKVVKIYPWHSEVLDLQKRCEIFKRPVILML